MKDNNKITKPIRNIVVSYSIFGILWILFSDILAVFFINNLGFYQKFQSVKGVIFIFVTGVFLYFILKKNLRKLEEKEEKLFKQAHFDSLTSLPNKRSLYENLAAKINSNSSSNNAAAPFSLFYLNLNNIDNLTEIKGHSQGSDLIKKIASHLEANFDSQDCNIYSYNYDQFILVFDNKVDDQELKDQANIILTSINELWEQGEINYYLNLDIGIAKFPDSGGDAEALISSAQLAARNIIFDDLSFQIYQQQMYLDKLEYENLKRDLRSAVKNGEFKLYYQPKIKINDNQNKIGGVEALIRWEHPTLGLVSPQRFIKIAEESSLIREIGDWVIEEAFKQLSNWQNKYDSDLSISVNLSPLELYDKNKSARIKNLSQKYKIRRELIEFEITENALLDNRSDTIKTLNELKNLDFSIALDDFGSGYSSLSYLSRLPIDTLKIDKSFIAKLADSRNIILIDSIINLSHKMNLKVIAEGVENSEQLEIMKKLNCDEIQGYYFYKALPVDQFEKILEENYNY
ncbi:diguanylate cyclase (GGDEF) domain-containing protein [Halanaerobium congolense]|uniref:Diguanylate cyclase (GGDEF) domain-containing protein n=1 Tax=Halanaerobium congolense TaxID=54121 RepID=A0A1I0AGR7_9FIRM|nr:bifunctional diguanylate cyclase/phosphodiesterase [Halanaerobium congolense]PTX17417.1 diguanylate cyclase (GGDEF)-like protein [Halanaerobium congolense]TDP26708.1 diguanylate cyclase (GGDEF)-like protein [Halanaerobium congolense]SDF43547.1 diguanylate cyclase (GGDEF) domain-containing protein [Halanaerobium congolense]SES93369.1 diguanylate cyclase (GGDEF) domain-containing protein [Halanaerobium congolense]SFP25692.1 diguanylate cyclase (GGDEF) domain-containing protein [Halanaerobium 